MGGKRFNVVGPLTHRSYLCIYSFRHLMSTYLAPGSVPGLGAVEINKVLVPALKRLTKQRG